MIFAFAMPLFEFNAWGKADNEKATIAVARSIIKAAGS
jgi:hypothetical protein